LSGCSRVAYGSDAATGLRVGRSCGRCGCCSARPSFSAGSGSVSAVVVVLAMAGVVFALATVRPRRWLPVWLVRWSLWPLATFMVLRGVLGMIGDVQQIASGESGPLTHQAIWDLALWAPLFLIWGLLWAATVITYTRRAGALPRSQPTRR